MSPKLLVKSVDAVEEVEPAILEVLLTLEAGETTRLRMNIFAVQDLIRKLAPHAGS